MDYKTFVTYTVYVSMIALERPDLREKVMMESFVLRFREYSMLFQNKQSILTKACACLLEQPLGG